MPIWLKIPASLFLLWHAAVLVIAPGPPSYLMGKVYPEIKPYLQLFNLGHEWGFFASDPAPGSMARYIVTTADGEQHIHKLIEAVPRNHPLYLRYASYYLSLARKYPRYVLGTADYLCDKHQELSPETITFFVGHQRAISRQDWLDGARPLDDGNMSLEYVAPVRCSDLQWQQAPANNGTEASG